MRVEGILITRRQTSLFRFIRCASRQPKQGCNHSPNGNVIERVHQNKNQQKTKEVSPCSATRPSSAKIADKTSPLLRASKNFSPKKALRTNHSVANPAVLLVKATPEAVPVTADTATTHRVRCMTQFVQTVVNLARCRSSHVPTDPSCAAIASEATGNFKGTSLTGCAFSKTPAILGHHKRWCSLRYRSAAPGPVP